MEIQPKYKDKLLEDVSYRFGNGLFVGEIVGFFWDKTKQTFIYTLIQHDNDCVNVDENDIHPLHSYIVADTETGLTTIIERDEKNV